MKFGRRARFGVAAVAAAGLALGVSAAASASPSNTHADAHSAAFDHIFVIMLENHSQSSVIDDPNAPYITDLATPVLDGRPLLRRHAPVHAELHRLDRRRQLRHPGRQRPERRQPRPPQPRRPARGAPHRLGRLHGGPAGQQARPLRPDAERQSPLYAKKHNPFVLFDDIKNNPARMAHVKDYSAMGADLNSQHAPQFVWISPNQCNDMHGGVYAHGPATRRRPARTAAPRTTPTTRRSSRRPTPSSRTAVHTITKSRAWTSPSAIVIVTDENDYTGNQATGGWESADGCCDSPYVAAGDPRVDATWPGGTYGGGLIPAIVVTAARAAARRRPHAVQPLLAADHHRGQLESRPPRPRRRPARRRRPDVAFVRRPRRRAR